MLPSKKVNFEPCLYYHACLHYVNKKWSDKVTDCRCCVYCSLKRDTYRDFAGDTQ